MKKEERELYKGKYVGQSLPKLSASAKEARDEFDAAESFLLDEAEKQRVEKEKRTPGPRSRDCRCTDGQERDL